MFYVTLTHVCVFMLFDLPTGQDSCSFYNINVAPCVRPLISRLTCLRLVADFSLSEPTVINSCDPLYVLCSNVYT